MADNTLKNLKYDTHGEITLAGSSNTYTGSTADPSALRGYFKGLRICAEANHDNTGAATLNLNDIGAGDIKLTDGSDPGAGAIQNGGIYDFVHDSTNWILLNPTDTGVAAGSIGTTELADEAVTYAKMQHVSATSRVLGRKTAGAGDVEECTLSEVLDFVGSAAQGDILYRNASAWVRLPAGTSGHFLQTQGTGANPQYAEVSFGWTYATEAATTSGTDVTLATGIPAGISEIEVMLRGVSVSTANALLEIRIGDSGGIETTGYVSAAEYSSATASSTSGFRLENNGSLDAADAMSGVYRLIGYTSDGLGWNGSGVVYVDSNNRLQLSTGYKDLSERLTQISLHTGALAFDGGTVVVRYR